MLNKSLDFILFDKINPKIELLFLTFLVLSVEILKIYNWFELLPLVSSESRQYLTVYIQ